MTPRIDAASRNNPNATHAEADAAPAKGPPSAPSPTAPSPSAPSPSAAVAQREVLVEVVSGQSAGARLLAEAVTRRSPSVALAVPQSNTANIEAARAAVGPLASALPEHGVDLEHLITSYGCGLHATQSTAQVAAAARLAFMRTALANNPGLADGAVRLRLEGSSSDTQSIVRLALGDRTGMTRYAECERVLRELRTLGTEERATMLQAMRGGHGFDAALVQQRNTRQTTVGAIDDARESLQHQLDAAVLASKRELDDVRNATSEMTRVFQTLPHVTRGAEFSVGALSAVGAYGALAYGVAMSAVTMNEGPLNEAVEGLGRAGGYLCGEFTDRNDRATALYRSYLETSVAYSDANLAFRRALAEGDSEVVVRARAEMDALRVRLASTGQQFLSAARDVASRDRQFDGDTLRAALNTLMTGVSAGAALGRAGAEATRRGVGAALGQLGQAARGGVKENAITEAAAQLIEQQTFLYTLTH